MHTWIRMWPSLTPVGRGCAPSPLPEGAGVRLSICSLIHSLIPSSSTPPSTTLSRSSKGHWEGLLLPPASCTGP